ncbi:MAG: efflux RND transporter periplasmic adaptor subunit [Planctomycetota bacterium]
MTTQDTTNKAPSSAKRWLGRVAVVIVCAAILSGAVVLRASTIDGQENAVGARAAPPLLVTVMTAERSDGYDETRRFVGLVEARRTTMASFERQGMVIEAAPDAGEVVTQGQLLARLDTARLDATKVEAEARLRQAKADVRLAEETFRRTTEARELDAVAEQALDDARRQLDSANAAVEVAEAALAGIDVDLAKSKLLAPFDAIVVDRTVDEGAVVSPGQVAFELVDRESPEARIGLAGPAVASVEAGQRTEVVIRGLRVSATVRAVLPTVGDRARTVEAILVLDRPLDGIRVGDRATLEVTDFVEADGFPLPLGALTEGTRGLWACYVAVPTDGLKDGATHQLERRELQLLRTSGDRVFVRGTLGAGELVATEGIHKLTPGLPVRVAEAQP